MKFRLLLLILLTVPILGTTDAMGQWVQTSRPSADTVYSLATLGTNLFAGTENGVFRSTDNGSSWVAADTGLSGGGIRALTVIGTDLVATSNSDIVYQSTDSGASWAPTWPRLPEGKYFGFAAIGTTLFAVAESYLYADDSVFRSTDNGANWTSVCAGIADVSIATMESYGTNLFIGTAGEGVQDVYRSTDSGTTWEAASSGLAPADQIFAFIAAGTNFFVGTGEGLVYRSTDSGASWTVANTGIPNGAGILGFEVSGTDLFVGTYGYGIFLSTNNGKTWSPKNEGFPIYRFVFENDYSFAIIGMNLFVTKDDGNVWRLSLSNLSVETENEYAPKPLTIYPNPVSHEATIGFATSAPSPANVTIFDVLGNAVAEPFVGTLEGGNHSLPWDASAVPAGTYYARVALASGNVQTVKIVKK